MRRMRTKELFLRFVCQKSDNCELFPTRVHRERVQYLYEVRMSDVKILVVEDEIELNGAYKRILETAHYKVKSAYNGAEALEIINIEGDPDVILLDLRMPIMDGIAFLKKYDAPRHPGTTVILFSNYEAQEEVDKAYDLGANHYILKAMTSPKELLHSVEMILKEKAKS